MLAYEMNGANGVDSIAQVRRPDPEPLSGQILIRMKAWSLNARDLLVIKGYYHGLIPTHIIALSDGAGEVVSVGPDVRRFKVGDRVSPTFSSSWIAGTMTASDIPLSLGGSIDGVLAELVACDENHAVRIPDHLSFQEAACLPCAGVVAWSALFGPRPLLSGQTVLTLGTGVVSTFAIQFASAAGARVIATSSSESKMRAIRSIGASETINYQTFPEWQEEVLRLTEGRGVDHVVEVGGGPVERSVASTAVGGQIHVVGPLNAKTLDPWALTSAKTLRGLMVGSRADHEAMNRMVELHKIHPLVGQVFAFDQVVDAYRALETGGLMGKLVIARNEE